MCEQADRRRIPGHKRPRAMRVREEPIDTHHVARDSDMQGVEVNSGRDSYAGAAGATRLLRSDAERRLGAYAPRVGQSLTGLVSREGSFAGGTIPAPFATWMSQRIAGRPRPRSGRRFRVTASNSPMPGEGRSPNSPADEESCRFGRVSNVVDYRYRQTQKRYP